MRATQPSLRTVVQGLTIAAGMGLTFAAIGPGGTVPTILADFDQPGTQLGEAMVDPLLRSEQCTSCHANYDLGTEPYRPWAASMMGQAGRDPIFFAALAIAEQDADFAGHLCLRCHAPMSWIEGDTIPTDGSGLSQANGDFDGVSCNFCHRLVDPVYEAGVNPVEDLGILAGLIDAPINEVHTGQFVIDPEDRRRGPFELDASFPYHQWRESSFHQDSLLCGTCHDVSNPVFTRQPDGTYDKNADGPHPTQDKRDEFPVERTYSEWANSDFALAAIEMGGRFGGNKTAVSSCQDCHMPDTSGTACVPGLGGIARDDLPQHHFNGANSWVLQAIRSMFPDVETGLSAVTVADATQRNIDMLQAAADLDLFLDGGTLNARVVNQTGHKLPTGYGEGRRMWLHVTFFDGGDVVLSEHGQYDAPTATLTTGNTSVFEIEQGLDANMSAATGIPAGPSFHFVLNNTIVKDNRIPPRGYNSGPFEDAQAQPVGVTYAEEHYWSDTPYPVPMGAVRVEVELFHQTTTKEYIEFLRDENTTNSRGLEAYNLWTAFGKSAPVLMASLDRQLASGLCATPVTYGLPKQNSTGTFGHISSVGLPSAAAGTFDITLTGARPNTFAQIISGPGSRNLPFAGGSLLIRVPIQRGQVFALDGQGDGSVTVPVDPMLIGTKRFYQIWYRDNPDPFGIGLSNALAVDICD
ncbi:MAG: hypothetical protein ACI8QZ_001090 [Chlamydiales bacterium]|jgi:hypothetical protein